MVRYIVRGPEVSRPIDKWLRRYAGGSNDATIRARATLKLNVVIKYF